MGFHHDAVREWLKHARCRDHNPQYRADCWGRVAWHKTRILASGVQNRICNDCAQSTTPRAQAVYVSSAGRHSFAHENTCEDSIHQFTGGAATLAERRRVWAARHQLSRKTTGAVADAMDEAGCYSNSFSDDEAQHRVPIVFLHGLGVGLVP